MTRCALRFWYVNSTTALAVDEPCEDPGVRRVVRVGGTADCGIGGDETVGRRSQESQLDGLDTVEGRRPDLAEHLHDRRLAARIEPERAHEAGDVAERLELDRRPRSVREDRPPGVQVVVDGEIVGTVTVLVADRVEEPGASRVGRQGNTHAHVAHLVRARRHRPRHVVRPVEVDHEHVVGAAVAVEVADVGHSGREAHTAAPAPDGDHAVRPDDLDVAVGVGAQGVAVAVGHRGDVGVVENLPHEWGRARERVGVTGDREQPPVARGGDRRSRRGRRHGSVRIEADRGRAGRERSPGGRGLGRVAAAHEHDGHDGHDNCERSPPSQGHLQMQKRGRGFGQDRSQDRLDDVELVVAGDERRRQLDDRVAAVVGAADEPGVEEAGQRGSRAAASSRSLVVKVSRRCAGRGPARARGSSPAPRTSPTIGRSRRPSSRSRKPASCARTWSSTPSRSNTSRLASADRAAHRVAAERDAVRGTTRCPSRNGSARRSRQITAPSGEYPLVRPFAHVIMSGR